MSNNNNNNQQSSKPMINPKGSMLLFDDESNPNNRTAKVLFYVTDPESKMTVPLVVNILIPTVVTNSGASLLESSWHNIAKTVFGWDFSQCISVQNMSLIQNNNMHQHASNSPPQQQFEHPQDGVVQNDHVEDIVVQQDDNSDIFPLHHEQANMDEPAAAELLLEEEDTRNSKPVASFKKTTNTPELKPIKMVICPEAQQLIANRFDGQSYDDLVYEGSMEPDATQDIFQIEECSSQTHFPKEEISCHKCGNKGHNPPLHEKRVGLVHKNHKLVMCKFKHNCDINNIQDGACPYSHHDHEQQMAQHWKENSMWNFDIYNSCRYIRKDKKHPELWYVQGCGAIDHCWKDCPTNPNAGGNY
jgi:hypothetical protein